MSSFFKGCSNDNNDNNEFVKYLKVKNIFKNKNEKFEDSLKKKNGIILIYDIHKPQNITKIYQDIEKNSSLFNQIKESYTVKVYEINEKDKYQKYIGYETEIYESIFLIRRGKDNKYMSNKYNLDFTKLKDIIKNNKNNNINLNKLNHYNRNNNNEIIKEYIDNSHKIKQNNYENIIHNKNNKYNKIEKEIYNNIFNSNRETKNIISSHITNFSDLFNYNNNGEYGFPNDYNPKTSRTNRNRIKNNLNDENKENKILKKELPKEPKEDDNSSTIIFKFPSNKIIKRNFKKDDKIKLMYIYINSLSDDIVKELKQKNFLLSQPFPKKIYSNLEDTFFDSGLYPDGVINIIPEDKNNN